MLALRHGRGGVSPSVDRGDVEGTAGIGFETPALAEAIGGKSETLGDVVYDEFQEEVDRLLQLTQPQDLTYAAA